MSSGKKRKNIPFVFLREFAFRDVKIRRQIEDAKRYVPCQHDERDDVHKKGR
jgi:hypothetical protein